MRSAPSSRIDFAVEIAVLDHVAHQRGILRRLAKQLRERHRGREALLRGFGQRMQHRRGENPGRNAVDADAELRELARRRQDEPDHAAFRCRIGGLADLARHRRRPRRCRSMMPRSPSCSGSTSCMAAAASRMHIESADQIDRDDAREFVERHRSVAADDALGRADAGAIDQDARGPCSALPPCEGLFGVALIGHVAMDRDAVDLPRMRAAAFC